MSQESRPRWGRRLLGLRCPPALTAAVRSEILDTELSEVLLDIIQGSYFRLVDGTIKAVLMDNADADRNE